MSQIELPWDLTAGAQSNNVQTDDLAEVALELTGQNDGASWHWIARRKDGGYAYVTGDCDYTGWDCVSSMDRHDAATLEEALLLVPQDERRVFEDMRAAGEKRRDNTRAQW